MAWTTPSTAVAGSTALTAAFWNEQVRDNLTALDAAGANAVGLVKVASASFSAQSSVSIDNCFTSAYSAYRIVFQFGASATSYDSFRLRAGGTDQATGSNYSQVAYRVLSNNTSGIVDNDEGRDAWTVGAVDDTAFPGISYMDIHLPAVAARTIATGLISIAKTTTSEAQVRMYGYAHQLATAYDGFTIFPNTGTITGFVSVYGYKV